MSSSRLSFRNYHRITNLSGSNLIYICALVQTELQSSVMCGIRQKDFCFTQSRAFIQVSLAFDDVSMYAQMNHGPHQKTRKLFRIMQWEMPGVVAQQWKQLPLTQAFHMGRLIQVLATSFQSSFPLLCLGRKQKMVQLFGTLPHKKETGMELLDSSLLRSVAQPLEKWPNG